MLELLINKFDKWTQMDADKFHNNINRSPIPGKYIWEFDENGVFLYRDIGSYYFSNKGKIYILTKAANKEDWNSHLLFFNSIKKNNICRIDIPIKYKPIFFKDQLLHYKEFIRPNNEYGRDYHLDVLEKKVDNDYFRQFITDSSLIIRELKQVSLEYNLNLPEVGISVFKRMYDSKGLFWIDFKKWNQPIDNFLNISIQSLNTVIFYLEYNNLGKFNRKDLISEAKDKWNLA